MPEVQLTVIKLIKIMLVASLIPPAMLLVVAAYNERVRRMLLWILTPLAILAVIAYVAFAPREISSIDEWNQIAISLKDGFIASLPFLIGLVILGTLAQIFAPSIREKAGIELHHYAREQYLNALLDWVEPQLRGMVELEGRSLAMFSGCNLKYHLRITGEIGSGKSLLLRNLLRQKIREAQEDENNPLPLWIDLDERFAAADGLKFTRLENVLPIHTRLLGWLLRREGQAHRLVFLIDSSVQNYGLSFAVTGGLQDHLSRLDELRKLIEIFSPCPFVLATPTGVKDTVLGRLVEQELPLELFSEEGVKAGARTMAKDQAPRLIEAIRADEGIWHSFVRRPVFLKCLVSFFTTNQRLPKDTRELFRSTVYPANLPTEQVEAILTRLAEKIATTRQYDQRMEDFAGIVRSATHAKPSQNIERLAEQIASQVELSGLVRRLPADPQAARPIAQISFAHPIFLAYATALGWLKPLDPRGNSQAPGSERSQAGQNLDAAWLNTAKPEALQADPILAEALVFFNNIEADPQQQAGILGALIEQGKSREKNSRFRLFLAMQCLQAMPAANRPAQLVGSLAARLIEEAAYDPEAVTQLRILMDPLKEDQRLSIYAQSMVQMDDARLEQTLRRLVDIQPGSRFDPSGNRLGQEQPGEIRAILWHGMDSLSRNVGQVWAACEPREALLLFQDLYEHGPSERRNLAIDLLGILPHEAAESYLLGLLKKEKDPGLRASILRSLTTCGADIVTTLLDLIANRQEIDSVRVYAAELLAHNHSPELRSSGTVREIVRTSRIPMPEQARKFLQQLLNELRGSAPADLSRWEDVVNPYVVGRPITDSAQFYGRQEILRGLCLAVDNSNPVLIIGEPRSGKTSLLYRLAAALNEEAAQGVPVRAVYLDIQGLQPYEFYETAIRTIIEGLHDPSLFADPNVPRPYSDEHFARDLDDLLTHLQSGLGPGGHLALLIDEADVFLKYPASMHTALRRITSMEGKRGLVLLLAGTDPILSWQQPEPPFYSNFLRLTLPRLNRKEATQLITEPVGSTFQYESEAIERILQNAQGRPEEIQAICQKLVSRALESGVRSITCEMVIDTLAGNSPRAELLAQAESSLGKMMDWLEAHPDATTPQLEEKLKHTWTELQKVMIQQVTRARKGKI